MAVSRALALTAALVGVAAVDCTDHSTFVYIPVEREVAAGLLPDGFCLEDDHPLRSKVPAGMHPLLLEFGKQEGCAQKGVPIFKTTFIEMKLEVPYVLRDGIGPSVYKPYIYASTRLDSVSSYLAYGLPTYYADMASNANNYTVQYKGMGIEAVFEHTSEEWGTLGDFPNFSAYSDAVEKPWFCKNLGKVRCASMTYQWDQMKIRAASARISFHGAIFGEGLADKTFTTRGIDTAALGSAQLVVPLSISWPFDCAANTTAHCPAH
eukprot:Hpha_TRINITY_DN11965_c0_g1::TRINITY_DN11965_c0_g1_i1::g.20443::m.20443